MLALRSAELPIIDDARQTRTHFKKPEPVQSPHEKWAMNRGYHDDSEGPRHHGLRDRPPALRRSISFHHCRTRTGTTAALTFAPAPRRRACSLPGPGLLLLPFPPSCHFPSNDRLSSAFPSVCASQQKETQMTSMDLDGWTRVKDRLRAEVGDDVYASWFARMELDGSEGDTVKLSVPTRFLKSWIQSHYAERVLACWQA